MIACVLCGQRPAAPGMALLCKQCDRERRRRIDHAVWLDDIQKHMQETLGIMDAFEKYFPDGAALFEEAHRVLAETVPRVGPIIREMRRKSDEADKCLQVAQDKGWAALTEESTFE